MLYWKQQIFVLDLENCVFFSLEEKTSEDAWKMAKNEKNPISLSFSNQYLDGIYPYWQGIVPNLMESYYFVFGRM